MTFTIFFITFILISTMIAYFAGVFSPSQLEDFKCTPPPEGGQLYFDMLDGKTVPIQFAQSAIDQKYSDKISYYQDDAVQFIYSQLSNRSKAILSQKEIATVLSYQELQKLFENQDSLTKNMVDNQMNLELLKSHLEDFEKLDRIAIQEVIRLETRYLNQIGFFERSPHDWIINSIYEQFTLHLKKQVSKESFTYILDIGTALNWKDLNNTNLELVNTILKEQNLPQISAHHFKLLFGIADDFIRNLVK